MIALRVTFDALCALQQASEWDGHNLASTARPAGAGQFDIEIDNEVLEAIAQQAMPGESASDTIIRLAFHYCGGRLN